MDLTKEMIIVTGVFSSSPTFEQIEALKKEYKKAVLIGKEDEFDNSIELKEIKSRVCFKASELLNIEESSEKDQVIITLETYKFHAIGNFDKITAILHEKYGFNFTKLS